MPLLRDGLSAAFNGSAQHFFRNIVLKGPQQHIGNAECGGNELQGAVARTLRGQCGPALPRPKRPAHGGRVHAFDLRPKGSVEGIVIPPVVSKQRTVHLLVVRPQPAFDGAAVNVRGQPQRGVSGLSHAHSVHIGAFPIRVKVLNAVFLMLPKPIQE